jgi:hypothetical protein
MPPAPGWFSTTTGLPSALASAGCAVRVIASTPEPVAFGRTMRTGLSPTCATEDAERAIAPVANTAMNARRANTRAVQDIMYLQSL